MHIVGTAGHVDHGKSALVTALTGTDPDRLPQERERGMTLDLGFAHLDCGDGVEAGIVDVPGHERYVHNMLSGAAGMELLLLVVAANEGAMPQTYEHLHILHYLNIRSTLVALTKMDLIPPDRGGSVCRELHAQLRGTIAQNAPIFAVSIVSGANLDVLRLALKQEIAALPPRMPDAPAYLPVDRVFAVAGHGTVVTGTLMQGRLSVGESVAVEPGARRARVRGIHVFGRAYACVEGGARVALNLAGIDRDEVVRGDAIVGDGIRARSSFAVTFSPQEHCLALLRRRTAVRVALGSADVLGTLVLSASPTTTATIDGELRLHAPVAAFAGARFVARRPSPPTLLGGGVVRALANDEFGIAAILRAHGLAALTLPEIAAQANVREDVAQTQIDALVASGEVTCIARPTAYVDTDGAQQLVARTLEVLAQKHREQPWAPGTTSLALSRTLAAPESLLVRVLDGRLPERRIVYERGYYALAEHRPQSSPEQRTVLAGLAHPEGRGAFEPLEYAGVLARVRASGVVGVEGAFDAAESRGEFVRVGLALYTGDQIARATDAVVRFLGERGRMTVADFRDLLGTSRKYAVPLLEWFDAHAVTLRDGDYRTLRKATAGDAPKKRA